MAVPAERATGRPRVFWTTETLDSPLIWSLVIQSPFLTWTLTGSRVPFAIGVLVSPTAGVAEGDPADDDDGGQRDGHGEEESSTHVDGSFQEGLG